MAPFAALIDEHITNYSAEDFKKTIFSPAINLEWTGGPDLYFRVETLSGTVLLAEP